MVSLTPARRWKTAQLQLVATIVAISYFDRPALLRHMEFAVTSLPSEGPPTPIKQRGANCCNDNLLYVNALGRKIISLKKKTQQLTIIVLLLHSSCMRISAARHG